METLNIEYVDAGEDFFDSNNAGESTVHQPMGLLPPVAGWKLR
jgi:hypothetical protein